MISYRFFGAFRLVLAILVLLQHFFANVAPESWMRAAHPYAIGEVAVLAFFALSGFVICEAIDRFYTRRPVAFILNRLLRIIPHFAVAMLISILVHAVFLKLGSLAYGRSSSLLPDGAFSSGNLLRNLLGFLPAADRNMSYNFLEIAWTIRVEVMFYAVAFLGIGLNCLGLGGRRPLGIRADAAAVGTLVVALFALSLAGWAPAMFHFVPHFAFGIAAYLALMEREGSVLLGVAALAGITLEAVYRASEQASAGSEEAWMAQTILLFVLLTVMCLAATLRTRRFVAADQILGKLTFPLYLIHQSVMVAVLSVAGSNSVASFAVAVVLSFATAGALCAIVDPTIDRLRNTVRGRRIDGRSARRAEAVSVRSADAPAT